MKNRSPLAAPYVITDTMPLTEQVDGKFYDSKAAFRAKGRALGLTEIGTEKRPPKTYSPLKRDSQDIIQKAAAEYRAGRRARDQEPRKG
jgi:hypothetical protein